jgi:hypothetical protein
MASTSKRYLGLAKPATKSPLRTRIVRLDRHVALHMPVGLVYPVEAVGACFKCTARFPATVGGRGMSIDGVLTSSQGWGLDR